MPVFRVGPLPLTRLDAHPFLSPPPPPAALRPASGKKASIDVTSKSSTDVLHSFLTAAGLDEVVVDGAVQRTKEWIAQDRIEAQEHRRAVERSKIHKQQQAHAQKDEALVRKIFSSTESELFLKAADD